MSSAAAATAAEAASPEVFHTLGVITRQLHDALAQLGVMPGLQAAAAGLPDARSRLSYIAAKTGEAAERVLNSVDQAKREHTALTEATRRIAPAIAQPGGEALGAFAAEVERHGAAIDAHLTDILLAQDFHDLTGQVVAKVVSLAADLEDSLVKLLLQAAPATAVASQAREGHALQGPAVGHEPRAERVSNQGEVDDLLASLGF